MLNAQTRERPSDGGASALDALRPPREEGHVFVFGSNLAGIHGAGSARHAHEFYGAQFGVGEGRTGDAYAIPTKDRDMKTLSLVRIRTAVDTFMLYAHRRPKLAFDVVKVGCGLAGYKDWQIAPMFHGAPQNVKLPDGWRRS